jgi:lipopolysaccharide/colanic/teichoic acid biosynthesis glycosyltransferase
VSVHTFERQNQSDPELVVATGRMSSATPQIDPSWNDVIPTILPSPWRRTVTTGRAAAARTSHQGKHQFHVLNEDLFRSALIRERKSADRSNQPFGVLLITLAGHEDSASTPLWKTTIEALSAARRETDVVGWLEKRAVLGVILPDMGGSEPAIAREMESRVRRELAMRVNAETAARFSIRLHLHLEPKLADGASFAVDPLILTLRSSERSATINDRMKRGLDVMGSLALLLILSPLFFLIAILVKLQSRGPVFFRQVRVGQAAKSFTMLKFRSMRVNAAETLHHEYVTQFIKSSGQVQGAGTNQLFKIANDPRVTSVGRILRKTSLDELPQLLNVLRGDMSLVGPRPPLQYEVDQYKPWHCRRVLEAKPGITGLWQVTGRSRTTFDEMVRLDLRYARTSSLWTDLKILLATPRAVISGKGAC